MEELTIGEIARRAGVRASTIRYYESINLLPQPRRVSGRRCYEPAILEHLAFIQVAQKLGFTLTEIQHLLQHEQAQPSLSESWQALARQKLAEVDGLIKHAVGVKWLLTRGLRCECSDLPACMDCVVMNCSGVSVN